VSLLKVLLERLPEKFRPTPSSSERPDRFDRRMTLDGRDFSFELYRDLPFVLNFVRTAAGSASDGPGSV